MAESEKLHLLSEVTYKHLEKTFIPGLRNIVATGKAYHESLVGVSSNANAHIEALLKVGHNCKTVCKGATQRIGEALFAIADTYRQIQAQIEETNKALRSEFLLPLEDKVESLNKEILQSHKRYQHQHKTAFVSYEKAENAVRKVQKKSKSRRSTDDSQVMQKMKEWEENLTKFRVQGAKLALQEERRNYCYLLDKCCNFVNISADRYIKSGSLLGRPLSIWKSFCVDPLTLPPESLAVISALTPNYNQLSINHNGYLTASPTRGESSQNYHGQMVSGHSEVDHDGLRGVAANAPNANSPRCKAIYKHNGDGESQLSFDPGDIILLIGEKSDGWHYGLNTMTNKYGWFPLSYVEALAHVSTIGNRYKSIGDLRDGGGPPGDSYSDIGDSHAIRRPMSMYHNSGMSRSYDAQQSGDNTGSDSYQEPGMTGYGDGKPDFWARGVHNNANNNNTMQQQRRMMPPPGDYSNR